MRKRHDADPIATPRPCAHPDVTYGGKTAPACMWGTTEALAIPPERDEIDRCRAEHMAWENLHRVARPELLDPDGNPWPSGRLALWEVRNA